MDKCMKTHHPEMATIEKPNDVYIIGALAILGGIILLIMVINLIFTYWYHTSYKHWYEREKIIGETI